MVATIGPLCTSAASTLALHLDRGEKRGRDVRGRLVRRAGRVFVGRRERRCRRAATGAEPTVPAQLLAMERTPGAWLSARDRVKDGAKRQTKQMVAGATIVAEN